MEKVCNLTGKSLCKLRKTVYGKFFRKPFSKTHEAFCSLSLLSAISLCSLHKPTPPLLSRTDSLRSHNTTPSPLLVDLAQPNPTLPRRSRTAEPPRRSRSLSLEVDFCLGFYFWWVTGCSRWVLGCGVLFRWVLGHGLLLGIYLRWVAMMICDWVAVVVGCVVVGFVVGGRWWVFLLIVVGSGVGCGGWQGWVWVAGKGGFVLRCSKHTM
jgi:hypothetical protein